MSQTFIHLTAVVDEGADIGAGSKIWHFCHISAGSRLGNNCVLGQNVFIDNNVVVGKRVKIQNNVSVYNGVAIEDDVFLGPSMVFTNVINPRSFIDRKNEFRKTIVRKGATIGANATILCGIEIGSYAMIGAGAVVLESVAPFALMVGNPARRAGWVSQAGMSLVFDSDGMAACGLTGKKYRLLDNILVQLE